MQALGYERYGVAGGDIGAGISAEIGLLAGERMIGTLVVTDPGAIATEYTPPTDHLTEEEQARHAALKAARSEDFGYIALQTTRPQSIAYGLTDSPVAQLTWIVEKIQEWTDPAKELPEDAVDLDHLLTLVSVYWFNRGGAGAANFLYETTHTAASWGEAHDRPQGFVSFGREPLIRRILDPEGASGVLERTRRRRALPGDGGPGPLCRRPAGIFRGPHDRQLGRSVRPSPARIRRWPGVTRRAPAATSRDLD